MKDLLSQVGKFGGTGLAATALHVAAYSGFIEFFGFRPLYANFLAFTFAVLFSFFGHSRWTFASHDRPAEGEAARMVFVKFVITAIIGLGINTACVYLVVDVFERHYGYSVLLMISIVPTLLFLVNKYWVFNFGQGDEGVLRQGPP